MGTSNQTPNSKIRSVKRSRVILKIALVVLATISMLVLAAGIAIYSAISHYYDKIDFRDPLNTDSPYYSSEYFNSNFSDETDFPTVPTVPDTVSPPTVPTVPDTVSPPTVPDTGSNISTTPITTPPVTTTKGENIDIPPIDDDYVMKFSDKVTNILLIGTDGLTPDDRGRSDSMIILSINKETGQIVMTSIMRDLYVTIPRVTNGNRINAAYQIGGVSLLVETIRENFKIQIDKYVRVNFDGFIHIIDALGGMDVTLNQKEINYLELGSNVKPGVVHLDGRSSLNFCRCRDLPRNGLYNDFARTSRQREALTILSGKLKSMSLAQMNDMLNKFLPEVSTNLTKSEIMSMLSKAMTYLSYDIKSYSLPISGAYKDETIRRMMVLVPDLKKNYTALEQMINGTYKK